MPDLTISFTALQSQRVQAAFATEENPSPGIADIKVWLIRQLRARVLTYERSEAEKGIQILPFDPT